MSYYHDGAGVSPEAFQKIITVRPTDRKLKVELKRLHDLSSIKEMKSETGVHPLEIFPEVVWEAIFKDLAAGDRGNMWQVHEVFRFIMKNSLIEDILFPQILKYKVKQFWNQPNPSTSWRSYSSDKHVPLGHFLELRLLSKRMRNAVDSFLQEDLLDCLRHPNSTSKSNPRKTTTLRSCDFYVQDEKENMQKLDQFCADFVSNSKVYQRFSSRSLSLELSGFNHKTPCDSEQQQFEQMKYRLLAFLGLFGDQIWHFKFESSHLEDLERGLEQVYLFFIDCLSLLPNLKWLQLKMHCNTRWGCECGELQAVKTYLPPKLPNLERIDFGDDYEDYTDWESEAVYRAVLAANPLITHLVMVRGQDLHLSKKLVPSLESFILLEPGDGLKDESGYEYANDFYNLEKMVNDNWPLKRLRMDVNLDGDSIIPVLKLLQRLPSLEQVTLNVQEVTIGGGIDFLKLPNLTELDFQFNPTKIMDRAPTHFFFSLQFLLYCKNLKKLKWHDESSNRRDAEEHLSKWGKPEYLIGFAGGLEDLSDNSNNIWQVFPQMECIEVDVYGKQSDERWDRIFRKYRRSGAGGKKVKEVETKPPKSNLFWRKNRNRFYYDY